MKTLTRIVAILTMLTLTLVPGVSAEEHAAIALTADVRYAANLFLSNFTEIGIDHIDAYTFDDTELVDFAHDHQWFNSNDSFEYGDYAGGNNCRVSDDRIQAIVDKYFIDSHTVDLTKTRFDYDGEYYYHCETGGWTSCGFAMVTSICPIEDNYYYVSFMVFGGGEAWDDSALSLSLEEAWNTFGHPSGYGSALVQAADISNRATYKMISYGTI